MNTANLQLEGLYATLTALFGALRDKGVFDEGEIDALLAGVEERLACDPNRPRELRDANIDAICFPARFLRLALGASEGDVSFTGLAARVGRAKTERSQIE
jgi:hypothetical protein